MNASGESVGPGQQLAFEELLSALSRAFVAVPPGQVDAEIERWLRRLVEFLGVDRARLGQVFLDAPVVRLTHFHAAEGVPPPIVSVLDAELPWYIEQLRDNRVIRLERIPEGLPPEAEAERAYLIRWGFKSHLLLPVCVGGVMVGAMGFACFREYRTWSDGLVKQLQLVAEVFGNALARKQAWQALTERLAFEELIADLVKTFVNAPDDDLDRILGEALGRLVQHTGVDRGLLMRLAVDGCARTVAHWVAPNRPAFSPPLDEYGWYASQLRQGRTLALHRLPDDLPEEAIAERARAPALGLQSLLAIPLTTGERTWGAIGLGVYQPRRWSTQDIQRLRLVGEIMMDALLRRQAQEAARRQRDELAHVSRVAVLGELTAALAHELNQPLAAIRTNAEALQFFAAQGKLADNLDAGLADIVGDATRAGDLIRRLRDLLLRRQLERTPLDLNRAVVEVKPILSAEARRHSVDLVLQLAPALPAVAGDRIQLQQVVLNLVRNAAEAMAGLAGRGAVTVATLSRELDRVTVRVEDQGPPIDDAAFRGLFTPFHTTKPDGLGMGLAISRSIVQAHGGHLWAERRQEGGLIVQFTLPVRA
jgi:signal transduction histidine kinase